MGGIRRLATPALIGAASVCLLVGALSLYIDREVFDSQAFADRATSSLANPDVRADVSERVTGAVLNVAPDAIAFRPVISGIVDGLIGTPAFQGVFRSAVYDLHRTIFGRSQSTITLAVADVGLLLTDALKSINPKLAAQIPHDLRANLLKISNGDALQVPVDLVRLGDDTHAIAMTGLLAALLLFCGAVALARPGNHRRALGLCGIAVGATGAVIFVGLELVLLLVPAALGPDDAAARGILDGFLGGLRVWSLALAASGVIVAAAASALIRPIDLSDTFERLRALATATPATRWRRALRALGLIVLGIAAIALRREIVDLAALCVGLGLLYVGVAELLRLWLPKYPEPAEEPDEPEPVRRRRRTSVIRALVTGGLAVLLLGSVVGLAVATRRAEAPPLEITACNGSPALCDMPFDQVAFPASHNSMSAGNEPGWLFANQAKGITGQLEDGIRGLLIDTHYGFDTPKGVATDLDNDPKSRAKLSDELGDEFVTTAERLRSRIGFKPGGMHEVFLCHGFCETGATKAVTALTKIHDFLIENPAEVLVISIEDGVSAGDTEAAFEKSGLIDLVYPGPLDPMPTLREMIASGHRVVVMGETSDGSLPWYPPQYEGLVEETPYDFKTPADLAAPASCEPNRGEEGSTLFLMNNFVESTPAPRPTLADQANAGDALVRRVDECEAARGHPVNLLAVDFYDHGDVIDVARRLNEERAQDIGSAP
ncbi:MAG: hypothetical protein QOG62_1375 [Thermoleophilaceae bacterium]|jgi:hypothetical protein|nr:hypothetical protein [Thermoleophilaceae bacterium]